jgi:hypothetical protein
MFHGGLADLLPSLETAVWVFAGLFGLAMVAFIARAAVAAVNDREEPIMTATSWMGALVGGLIGAVAIAMASGFDIVAMLADLVAGHPMAVSNIGVAALGWLSLEGVVPFNGDQYFGIAMLIVGIVLVVTQGVELSDL